MTTGGLTDYPRASVKNFDVWLRAHRSQPLSKGVWLFFLTFLDFFLWLLWSTGTNLPASPASKASLQSFSAWGQVSPLAAPVPPYIITWCPPQTSAKMYISPGSYHPSNLPVQWLIWMLPPLLSLKQWLFANKTIRPHVCEGVRSTHMSTWQVSGLYHHPDAARKCSISPAWGEWSVHPLLRPCCVHYLERLSCHQPRSAYSSDGAPGELLITGLSYKSVRHIIYCRRSYATGRWEFTWTFASKELLIISYLTAL